MTGAGASPPSGADRRLLVAGNWKMHLTHLEAIAVVQKLAACLTRPVAGRSEERRRDGGRGAAKGSHPVEVSLHPAFTALRTVQTLVESEEMPIVLGAQDVHWEMQGAWTGEISPLMLAKLNVRYVIVGHSERRQYLGETDEMVRRKNGAVLAAGMTPICCVGETAGQREAGEGTQVVLSQVTAALDGVSADLVARMVVAYEPIWAIGTGATATPADAQGMAEEIRRGVTATHGQVAGAGLRVLYGGSVKAQNTSELLAGPDVDGALVGGASLDPEELAGIVAAAGAS